MFPFAQPISLPRLRHRVPMDVYGYPWPFGVIDEALEEVSLQRLERGKETRSVNDKTAARSMNTKEEAALQWVLDDISRLLDEGDEMDMKNDMNHPSSLNPFTESEQPIVSPAYTQPYMCCGDQDSLVDEFFACRGADYSPTIPLAFSLPDSIYCESPFSYSESSDAGSSGYYASSSSCEESNLSQMELYTQHLDDDKWSNIYAPEYPMEAANERSYAPLLFDIEVLFGDDDRMDDKDAYQPNALGDCSKSRAQTKRELDGCHPFPPEPVTIVHAQVDIIRPRPVHLLPAWMSE